VVEVGDLQVLYNDIGLPVDANADAFEAGIAANATNGFVAANLETRLGASLIVRPGIKSTVTNSAREIGMSAVTNETDLEPQPSTEFNNRWTLPVQVYGKQYCLRTS